jgi:hypothetical protein
LSSCGTANISFASFSASQSSDHFLSAAAEAIMARAELASRANRDPADADRRRVSGSDSTTRLGCFATFVLEMKGEADVKWRAHSE